MLLKGLNFVSHLHCDTVLIYFPRVHNWLYSMLNFEEHGQRIGETLCNIFASFVNLN